MRIAVTYENGQIFQHFGRTEQFKFYDAADGKIVSEYVAGTNGAGHGALAGLLKNAEVDVLICGGAQASPSMAEIRAVLMKRCRLFLQTHLCRTMPRPAIITMNTAKVIPAEVTAVVNTDEDSNTCGKLLRC